MLYAGPHPVNADPLPRWVVAPSQTMTVDLNLDAGEDPDAPDALFALAHRVNLACGGHAGDPDSLARACALAAASGVRVGAHPSYPDRTHFGRLPMPMAPEVLAQSLRDQCGLLLRAARGLGLPVGHVKLHGALYHAAHDDPGVARVALEACRDVLGAVEVLGMPRGCLHEVARALGMPFLREGFADRGYGPGGTLLPRGAPGAVLDAPAAARQCRALVASGQVETVCVHGDGPEALAVARAVRAVLDEARR